MRKISFIVPTLNRGHYVVRAVASCLEAGEQASDIEVEVVVLDSQSDDGSWELLQSKFGEDTRVKLVQNKRGLGPTQSWIDGLDCATGSYVTFVWSDDYISPRFVRRLLPLIDDETNLAIGAGVMRNIDDDTPLPVDARDKTVSRADYLAGYFPPFGGTSPKIVTPICALFDARSFAAWKILIGSWGRSTPLREQIVWKRAIGPDLLLYFTAALSSLHVPYTLETVAHCSAHQGSITVSSSKYVLRTGYWLARCWLVRDSALAGDETQKQLLRMSAETVVMGWILCLKFPNGAIPLEDQEIRTCFMDECASVWARMREQHSLVACASALASALLFRLVPRRYRRAAT